VHRLKLLLPACLPDLRQASQPSAQVLIFTSDGTFRHGQVPASRDGGVANRCLQLVRRDPASHCSDRGIARRGDTVVSTTVPSRPRSRHCPWRKGYRRSKDKDLSRRLVLPGAYQAGKRAEGALSIAPMTGIHVKNCLKGKYMKSSSVSVIGEVSAYSLRAAITTSPEVVAGQTTIYWIVSHL